MGFTFEHWRPRKKDGLLYYKVRPSEKSFKHFRAKIKEKTKKTLTLKTKAWLERVNPVIRGKVSYYLTIYKAIQENRRYLPKFLWK